MTEHGLGARSIQRPLNPPNAGIAQICVSLMQSAQKTSLDYPLSAVYRGILHKHRRSPLMFIVSRPEALSAAVPVYDVARRRVLNVHLHFPPHRPLVQA